jgi:hypothetical protein
MTRLLVIYGLRLPAARLGRGAGDELSGLKFLSETPSTRTIQTVRCAKSVRSL